jgi:hypothetical protein
MCLPAHCCSAAHHTQCLLPLAALCGPRWRPRAATALLGRALSPTTLPCAHPRTATTATTAAAAAAAAAAMEAAQAAAVAAMAPAVAAARAAAVAAAAQAAAVMAAAAATVAATATAAATRAASPTPPSCCPQTAAPKTPAWVSAGVGCSARLMPRMPAVCFCTAAAGWPTLCAASSHHNHPTVITTTTRLLWRLGLGCVGHPHRRGPHCWPCAERPCLLGLLSSPPPPPRLG